MNGTQILWAIGALYIYITHNYLIQLFKENYFTPPQNTLYLARGDRYACFYTQVMSPPAEAHLLKYQNTAV